MHACARVFALGGKLRLQAWCDHELGAAAAVCVVARVCVCVCGTDEVAATRTICLLAASLLLGLWEFRFLFLARHQHPSSN